MPSSISWTSQTCAWRWARPARGNGRWADRTARLTNPGKRPALGGDPPWVASRCVSMLQKEGLPYTPRHAQQRRDSRLSPLTHGPAGVAMCRGRSGANAIVAIATRSAMQRETLMRSAYSCTLSLTLPATPCSSCSTSDNACLFSWPSGMCFKISLKKSGYLQIRCTGMMRNDCSDSPRIFTCHNHVT